MKLVINTCYGGFGISKQTLASLPHRFDYYEKHRDDEQFVETVEKFGQYTWGKYSELRVVEIPDNATDYEIDEYDGFEGVRYVVDGKIHYADYEDIEDEEEED